MKVYLVAPTMGRHGGVERFTTEVASGLAERGHELTILSGTITRFPGAVVEGMPALPLPPATRVFADLMCFGPRADRRLRSLDPEAVVYRPLGAATGPGVITAHSCHAAWVADRGRVLGRKSLNPLDRALLRMERRAYGSAGLRVTTVSRRCAAEISRFYGVDPETIAVTPPAVDPVAFNPPTQDQREAARRKFGLGDSDFAVGTVANYAFLRKQVNLSQTACAAAGASLLVAGEPGRSQTDELEPSTTRILGPVTNMPEFYRSLDAFVLPSVNEAYGMAAHEAMACGVPTIVSERCGVADFFDAGHHALVVDVQDCDAGPLTDAIHELRHSRIGEQLASAGAEWAARRTWEHVTADIEGVLERTRD